MLRMIAILYLTMLLTGCATTETASSPTGTTLSRDDIPIAPNVIWGAIAGAAVGATSAAGYPRESSVAPTTAAPAPPPPAVVTTASSAIPLSPPIPVPRHTPHHASHPDAEASEVQSPPKHAKKNGQYDVVRVFFGTDRVVSGNADAPAFSSQHAPSLTFGSVDVSIPPHHVTGIVETPLLWKLQFQRDPNRDVTILKIAITSYNQFQAEVRSRALNASTPSVLLFVHGYNVSFEDAAMRTAQMAHDLQFAGVPVFFSWPSRGNLIGYFADGTAIERAQDDIEQFVTQVLAATPGANLYVIAHSMGNRGITRALVSFARHHPDEVGRIREVILAAPDIDTDVFVHQIAPDLVAIGAPVTLYASSTDHALRISEAIWGGPRAGDSGENMVLLKGIETIDVTNVDTDLTGHSYVSDQRSILSDLYYIIQDDTRANRRFGLTHEERNGSEYWRFSR